MPEIIGILGIVTPAALAIALTAWSWRSIQHHNLYVMLALIVMYGLQSLAIAPLMSYLFEQATPATVEQAQTIAGESLILSTALAVVVGLPLLRALANALRVPHSAVAPA